MRPTCCRVYFTAVIFSLAVSAPIASSQTTTQSSEGTIACRVIELKTAQTAGVTLVVFHQAENADRDSVGAFLRSHDGASVEFEAGNGSWQAASVFRLKSCFGRGLLVLPAGRARLAEGDKFLLRSGTTTEG
jgi:hypothetical protein